MRRFTACRVFAAALLACDLSPTHVVAQQFNPRERFEVPARLRLSQPVLRSLMKNQVTPSYPEDARSKRIQGVVVTLLSVDAEGRVSYAKVVSGNPLLAEVTVQAVRRLRFRPYYQMGEAVPFEGQISYLFQCSPHGSAVVSLAPIKQDLVSPQ
jgi:TonB family protein